MKPVARKDSNKIILVDFYKKEEEGPIVDQNAEKVRSGVATVSSVGGEIKDLKEGDKVVVGTFAGQVVEFDQPYLIVTDSDVSSILEE